MDSADTCFDYLENRDKNKRLRIYCRDENEIQKQEGIIKMKDKE